MLQQQSNDPRDPFDVPLPDPNDPAWKDPPPVEPPPAEPQPPIDKDDPKPPPFVPPVEPPVVTPPAEDVSVEEVVEELSDIIACPDDTGQTRGFTVNPPAISDCACQDEILVPAFSGIGSGLAAIMTWFSNIRPLLLASRADEVGDIYRAVLGMKKQVSTKLDGWIRAYNKLDEATGTSFVDDALRAKKLANADDVVRGLRQGANTKIIAAQDEAKKLIKEIRAGSDEFKTTFYHHAVFNIVPKWNPKTGEYVLDASVGREQLVSMLNARILKWTNVDKLSEVEIARRSKVLSDSMDFLVAGTAKSSDYMGIANTSIEFKISRITQLKDTIKQAEKTYQDGAKQAKSIAKTYKHMWEEELLDLQVVDIAAIKDSTNPMQIVVHNSVKMTRKEFLSYLDELEEVNAKQRAMLGADLKGLARAKKIGGETYKAYIRTLALRYTAWAAIIGGLILDVLNVLKFTEERVCWDNPKNDSYKTAVDFDNECNCRKCPENSKLCEHDQFKWSRTYTSGQLPLGVTLPGSRTRTELNQCVKENACPPAREVVSLSTYKLLWDESKPEYYDRAPCACWCKDHKHTNKRCNKRPGAPLPKNPDYRDSWIPFSDSKGGMVCAAELPPDGKSETSWIPWNKSVWHWDKDQCGYVCKNGKKPEECAVDGLGILAEGVDPWDLFDDQKCECYGESLLQNLVP